jgi:streptomycin 6-kinase
VRLRAVEPALGAMLLERLDANRSLSAVGIEEAVEVAGRLLRRLAIQPPDGLRVLQTVAGELARNLPERWERYGRPLPRRVLDQACDLAIRLGASAGNLLVNYDLHYADVLAGTREPWLVVDPKVVVGDPEFGAAQLLWCRLEEIEAQGGLERQFGVLTEAAGLDPVLARAWTLVRCVDYWLWGLSVGLTYDPARCERIINWLV